MTTSLLIWLVYKHIVNTTLLNNLLVHVSIVDGRVDLSWHSAGKPLPDAVVIDSGPLECVVRFPAVVVGRRIDILFSSLG